MGESWSFHNPVDVRFGIGSRSELMPLMAEKKCLIVCSSRGRLQFEGDPKLSRILDGISAFWVDNVSSNPSLHELQETIAQLAEHQFDLILGFGGGSPMDVAKVLSIGLSERLLSTPLEELISNPSLHENETGIPLYMLPTTAGTGSEVTPFATVWDHKLKKKLSLAGPNMFPTVAVVDPECVANLPMEPTISTGLDAINQAIESIWNHNANPISMSYAFRALKLGLNALPGLMGDSSNIHLRTEMAECSLLAGLSISHTRTALCHSISYPITAHFGVPHGLACAFTMTAVLKHNLRSNDERFEELERFLGNGNLIDIFESLCRDLRVRDRVMEYVPNKDVLLDLVSEMYTPGRASNSLEPVTYDDIKAILIASVDAI